MIRAIVIVLAVLVPLFVDRAEVVLFVAHHLIEATRDVGPAREIEWQRGPEVAGAPPSERPPNIVLILADDMGWNGDRHFSLRLGSRSEYGHWPQAPSGLSDYRVPNDRDVIGQELFLFENGGFDVLEDLVDSQFSKIRVSVLTPNANAASYIPVIEMIKKRAEELFAGDAEVIVTGGTNISARMATNIMGSMQQSYLLAAIAITLMMIAFRPVTRRAASAARPRACDPPSSADPATMRLQRRRRALQSPYGLPAYAPA